jgi:threonine synthase
MEYYSTKNRTHRVSLKEAVLKGLAPDNGLYMPVTLPTLPEGFLDELKQLSNKKAFTEIGSAFFGEDIPSHELKKIAKRALDFETPVVKLDDNTYVLELWHGPTLAFKDVGARYMAQMTSYFMRNDTEGVHVLVATSGDTGSAVANGFFNVPGVKVTLLYPSGMVSPLQEKQLTTLGGNITALEVKGVFDDCQRLVKTAFLDADLNKQVRLTSANSINLARFMPQSFYYFNAYSQLHNCGKELVFSVPSGNYGNLTAGLIAKRMGLPIKKFISANNMNHPVYDYIKTGNYEPKATVATLSNAMDVGAPSNFERLLDLCNHSHEEFTKEIEGYFYDDASTREAIREVYDKYGYTIDPHGAVAYLALKEYRKKDPNVAGVILGTAHPAKFNDSVNEVLGHEVEIPEALQVAMHKEKQSTLMNPDYEEFKRIILAQHGL